MKIQIETGKKPPIHGSLNSELYRNLTIAYEKLKDGESIFLSQEDVIKRFGDLDTGRKNICSAIRRHKRTKDTMVSSEIYTTGVRIWKVLR